MKRWLRVVVTCSVVAGLFAPVAFDRDGIPLSTYPMYSRSRSDEVSLVTANGLESGGGRIRLGLDVIGGSDDPLVVAGELRSAIGQGRVDGRCERIADRIDPSGTRGDGAAPGIVAVEIVTERHDVVERTAGRPSLLSRDVHARCEVAS